MVSAENSVEIVFLFYEGETMENVRIICEMKKKKKIVHYLMKMKVARHQEISRAN